MAIGYHNELYIIINIKSRSEFQPHPNVRNYPLVLMCSPRVSMSLAILALALLGLKTTN